MLKPQILAFSIFLFSGLITPAYAFVAAAPAPYIELFSVGYKLDTIEFVERNGVATHSQLLRIDPDDGSIIEVGDTGFSNCKALDFNQDGNLYAKCQRPDPPHEPVLIMLNPQTGQGTEIGETGVTENISDIAIDEDGSLFAYEEPGGDHNLHQVDASTGAANFVGNPGIEGKGNAMFFWGAFSTLKLISWGDDQNRLFEIDTQTAQPTFVTNLEMIDLTGAMVEEGPCVMTAASSTRSVRLEPILEAAQLDRIDATKAGITIIDGFRFEAVGLNEILVNGAAAAAAVDNRLVEYPQYALSVIDLDFGISILTKTIEPGYMLDGIALRPLPPRPIPTLSQWGLLTASAFLMLAALYYIVRKKSALKNA